MPNTTNRSVADAIEETARRLGYRSYDWDGHEINPASFKGFDCPHTVGYRYARINIADGREQIVLACIACYRFEHNTPMWRPRSEYPGPLSELPCIRDSTPFASPEQAAKAFERVKKQLLARHA